MNTINRDSRLFNLTAGQKMKVDKWDFHTFKGWGHQIKDEYGSFEADDNLHAGYGLVEGETKKRWIPSYYIQYNPHK